MHAPVPVLLLLLRAVIVAMAVAMAVLVLLRHRAVVVTTRGVVVIMPVPARQTTAREALFPSGRQNGKTASNRSGGARARQADARRLQTDVATSPS